MKQDAKQYHLAIAALRARSVGVLPTDTLYGIVGSARESKTVHRIYRLRKRNSKKPMIILIGDIKDLLYFGVKIDSQIKKLLNKVWPGKVSVVMPIGQRGNFLKRFKYLHRGTGTLAFRVPKSKKLRGLLEETGPLVAPSANFEGETSAKTIRAAKKYFGERVDFYIDAGRLDSKPSTIIEIKNGKTTVLRKGAVRI